MEQAHTSAFAFVESGVRAVTRTSSIGLLLLSLTAVIPKASGALADSQNTIASATASDSCLVEMTGDVNLDSKITVSDLICAVHAVFLGPCQPQPCRAAADVTCNGVVTSADLITMVNYIFKSGPPYCDVCTIIPEMWTCD